MIPYPVPASASNVELLDRIGSNGRSRDAPGRASGHNGAISIRPVVQIGLVDRLAVGALCSSQHAATRQLGERLIGFAFLVEGLIEERGRRVERSSSASARAVP
jgi:hypothetical protein